MKKTWIECPQALSLLPLMPSVFATVVALGLAGCDNAASNAASSPTKADVQAAKPAVAATQAAAFVNGHAIAKSALSAQNRGPTPPGMQEKMMDDLIMRELVRQEFEKQHLESDPEVAEKLDNMLRITYSQLAAEYFLKTLNVSDEELRKEYNEKFPPNQPGEYKARHILVESEKQAMDIIGQLQKGGKFDELARKFSKDPGSKDKGGDLGWFEPSKMVQPFSVGVAALKNGEFTQQPVQSKFGWHVILRDDAREKKAPDFEAEKERLRNGLKMQKFQAHIEELKKTAQIERKALPEPKQPAMSGLPPLGSAARPAQHEPVASAKIAEKAMAKQAPHP